MQNLNELNRGIAESIYNKAPDVKWISGNCVVKAIYGYMESQITFSLETGKSTTVGIDGQIFPRIEELRSSMAELNQGRAWYTMVVTVQEDGKFKFDFDYDHLPTFDILPDPEDWEKEFKAYPNPALQAHVQDWMDGRVKDEDWRTVIQRLRDLNPSSNP